MQNAKNLRKIYEVTGRNQQVILQTGKIMLSSGLLKDEIPKKAQAVNGIQEFWFNYTKDIIPNAYLTTDLSQMPREFQCEEFNKKAMLVKKLNLLPIETIISGYMDEFQFVCYKVDGRAYGKRLPEGMKLSQKFTTPIFMTKRIVDDKYGLICTEAEARCMLGENLERQIHIATEKLYEKAFQYAKSKNIILAEAKFRFGLDRDGQLCLAVGALTPDNCLYWAMEEYKEGVKQKSYEKGIIENYLGKKKSGLIDKMPSLPKEVIEKTSERYVALSKKFPASFF